MCIPTLIHSCCYQLIGFCVSSLPSAMRGCFTYQRVCRVFSLYVAAYESASVYMFSDNFRDVNEICDLTGPMGWPEMSIRHYYSTPRKNCSRAQIWLIFSHHSCLRVLDALPLLSASSFVGRKFDGEMDDVTCLVIQWLLILRGTILACLLATGFRPGIHHLDRRR
jgi:hypothetical protein